jgi:hypothetical protein
MVIQSATRDFHDCDEVSESGSAAVTEALFPPPKSLRETGLSQGLIEELTLKQLQAGGILDLSGLVERIALPGVVLEPVLAQLREQALVEVRSESLERNGLRYVLTDRGRAAALDAFGRSGYLGQAPIAFELYTDTLVRQSVRRQEINRASMQEAFSDAIVSDDLVDRIGPALHSGRPLFMYGPPGTGKTYLGQRMIRALTGPIGIPHAVLVADRIIRIFDPALHRPIDNPEQPTVLFAKRQDRRFALCHRPLVATGGELTLDMLDVRYDAATRNYRAPVQLLAANGVLLVDDLGRQRASTQDLLNRWIVPLEEKRDHFDLEGGGRFSVPFDTALVFSTNLNPLELADEAFLRRLGYKIRFDYLSPEQYTAIWRQVCEANELEHDPQVLHFVIHELHGDTVPLLPCHPRDLIGLAVDRNRYLGVSGSLSREGITWAWRNYFVTFPDGTKMPAETN